MSKCPYASLHNKKHKKHKKKEHHHDHNDVKITIFRKPEPCITPIIPIPPPPPTPPTPPPNPDAALYAELEKATLFDENMKIRYIPSRPNLPNPPFPEQYLPDAVYPWFANTIPSEINELSPPRVPNGDEYDKFRSIQYSLFFYMGIDMFTVSPDDPRLTVFITNLRDRGPDNYRKKVYMWALTCEKMGLYKEKVDTFLNEFYSQITTYSQPVLSAFRKSLLRFFLAMHVGYDDYPDYVLEYFNIFIDIVGFGDPNRPGRNEAMIWGRKTVPLVREYFAKRNEIIKETQDKTSIMFHWFEAGLDPQGLVMEAIHNIIAFSQFNNVVYLLINDKYNGTQVPPPVNNIKYDFFTRFKQALTDSQRLDVIRELYRLLTPNNTSFSRVIEANQNDPNIVIQSRHLHKVIMASIEGAKYFGYTPQRYVSNFETDFNQCQPNPPTSVIQNFNPADYFITSPVDDQTLLPITNTKMIPVFPNPSVPPSPSDLTYMPFGLGYRRCPGEMMVYYITIKLLDKIKDLQFEFRQPGSDYPPITLAPFSAVPDNIFVVKTS